MTTHSVFALLISAALVAILPTPSALAQEQEATDFAALIVQLDANKAVIRDEAKKKLIEAGVPAVGMVLKTLLDKESPRETQARCIAILRAWEKASEEKMLANLKETFKDLNPADYPHVEKSLSEIKRLCLRKFRFTPAQAVEHLESKGCRFAKGDRSPARIFLNKWSGKPEDFQVIQVLKGRSFEINNMQVELLPALKGLDVKTMRFARPKGSTGRNQVFYKLTKQDFEIIAGFYNLRDLSMEYFEFDNESLKPLAEEDCLEVLRLSPGSNDETLGIVSGISSLEALHFGAAKVSTEGFAHIAKLQNLTTLYFPRIANDEMLETVGKLTKLRSLQCGYIQEITGDGFKHLKNCEQLKDLYLTRGIDSASLGFLGSLKNLESLKLTGYTINDSAMVHIAKAEKLRSLRFTNTLVRGTSFSQLKNLPELGSIHFEQNNSKDQRKK